MYRSESPMFHVRFLFVLLAIVAISFSALAADDAPALFRQAQDFVRREQYAAAVPLLEKCVAVEPGNSKFHQWLGRALGLQAAQNGIVSGAMSVRRVKAELEKAIELDPMNLEARQDLAVMYHAAPGFLGGSNAKAAEQIAFIRRHDPALALQLEGDFLFADKKYEAALSAYQESERLHPRPMIQVRISLAYQQRKDWTQSFAALDRALAWDANFPFALYQVGRTAALSGHRSSLDQIPALSGITTRLLAHGVPHSILLAECLDIARRYLPPNCMRRRPAQRLP